MNSMTYYLSVVFCIICLAACSRVPADYDRALTNGYKLVSVSEDDVRVLLTSNSSWLGTPIPAKVIEIAWNDQFILAKQQELQSRGDFPGDTLQVVAPGKFNYWIVDIVKTNSFGPLSARDFQDKIRLLGATNLNLKAIDKIKWPPDEDYLDKYYKNHGKRR